MYVLPAGVSLDPSEARGDGQHGSLDLGALEVQPFGLENAPIRVAHLARKGSCKMELKTSCKESHAPWATPKACNTQCVQPDLAAPTADVPSTPISRRVLLTQDRRR